MKRNVTILITILVLVLCPIHSDAKESEPVTLLPEILGESGFTRNDAPTRFAADDLWKHIDGAADQYLLYGCRSLDVAYYKSANPQTELSIEMYSMTTADNAFGIYSSQKPPEGPFLEIGTQGYRDEGVVNFFKGSHYVRMQIDPAKGNEDLLVKASTALVRLITEPSTLPKSLGLFPAEHLIAESFGYIPDGILGCMGVGPGYTARYRIDDNDVEMILISTLYPEKREALAGDLKKTLTQRNKTTAIPYPTESGPGFRLSDKYRGVVTVVPAHKALLILTGTDNNDWIASLLQKLNDTH